MKIPQNTIPRTLQLLGSWFQLKTNALTYLIHLVGICNDLDWACPRTVCKYKNATLWLLNQTPVEPASLSLLLQSMLNQTSVKPTSLSLLLQSILNQTPDKPTSTFLLLHCLKTLCTDNTPIAVACVGGGTCSRCYPAPSCTHLKLNNIVVYILC